MIRTPAKNSAASLKPAVCVVRNLIAALLFASAAAGAAEGPAETPVLDRLREGNQRFVEGRCQFPNSDAARRTETGQNGQKPFVTVLACADSRVPVEHAFDQGIGDVFVVRVAGNVADVDEIGSIEYGVGHLHTPLLVVLGHTKCGAVTAVVERAEVHGHIPQLVDNIVPAVHRTRRYDASLEGSALVSAAIRLNVWQSIEDILTHSETVRAAANKGEVSIVGAMYNIETGAVEWLGPHPEQSRLLNTPVATPHPVAPAAPAADPHARPAAPADGPAAPSGAPAPQGRSRVAPAKVDAPATTAQGTEETQHAPTGAHPAPADKPAGPSPLEAYKAAREGNTRFVLGLSEHPRLTSDRRTQTASAGQKPFASVLSCSDSRVPVELLLDQGVGDLFVVRVAGNVADTDELGTLEYGVGHLGTPLLIVLGHSGCGAVTAVAEGAALHGNIPALVENIQPAVQAVRLVHPELSGKALAEAAIRAHVWQTIATLLRESQEIRALARERKLMLVGGIYRLESGEVDWMGEHPQQVELIGSSDAPARDDHGTHARNGQ